VLTKLAAPSQAALPKRAKTAQRALTQDELIAEALETEELNIMELNDFLTEEEETRLRNANLKRAVVDSPFIRWLSRGEKVRVPMVLEVEIPPSNVGNGYGKHGAGGVQNITGLYRKPYTPSPLGTGALPYAPTVARPLSSSTPAPSSTPTLTSALTTVAPIYAAYSAYSRPPALPSSSPSPTSTATTPAPRDQLQGSPTSYYVSSQPQPQNRAGNNSQKTISSPPTAANGSITVKQARNYIMLDTPKATPAEDMAYLFGSHVNWGSVKVLPRNHPSSMFATVFSLCSHLRSQRIRLFSRGNL
jgi:vacuolar protein sorting-associated protein 72